MRTYGLLIGFIVVFLLIVAGIFFVMRETSQPQEPTDPSSTQPLFPDTGTTGPLTPPQTMELPLRNGESLRTKDFLTTGVAVADPANPGNYYLAGSSGYCDLDTGVCPSGAASEDFEIIYHADEHTFSIALLREPLGAARRAAETFLAQTLGVSVAQLCKLSYYLTVDSYTNAFFAGDNLGFSECPGATALP